MAIFTLSVLTDEFSQDFGRACEVAAREFGLELGTGFNPDLRTNVYVR